jgi:chromosome segregation ATPase
MSPLIADANVGEIYGAVCKPIIAKYNEQTNELAAAKAKVESLTKEIADMVSVRDCNAKIIGELTGKVAERDAKIAELNDANKLLANQKFQLEMTVHQMQCPKLPVDNDANARLIEKLTAENQKLADTNKLLTDANREIGKLNVSLHTINANLASNSAVLTDTNKLLTTKIQKMDAANTKLIDEKDELRKINQAMVEMHADEAKRQLELSKLQHEEAIDELKKYYIAKISHLKYQLWALAMRRDNPSNHPDCNRQSYSSNVERANTWYAETYPNAN